MRQCILRSGTLCLGLSLVLCSADRASASLFATFNLHQSIVEQGSPFFGNQEFTPVIDTALPFQQTVTQTTASNGITSTYSAYDNGSTAGLTINSSAYLVALNNFVGEATAFDFSTTDPNYTTFSFTQPVSYTIGYQMAGTAATGDFHLRSSYGPDPANFVGVGPLFSKSGVMLADVVYTLDEAWGLNNIDNTLPANLSGTDSISMTFTVIPEPSSLSLLILPAAMLARRSRRGALVPA